MLKKVTFIVGFLVCNCLQSAEQDKNNHYAWDPMELAPKEFNQGNLQSLAKQMGALNVFSEVGKKSDKDD